MLLQFFRRKELPAFPKINRSGVLIRQYEKSVRQVRFFSSTTWPVCVYSEICTAKSNIFASLRRFSSLYTSILHLACNFFSILNWDYISDYISLKIGKPIVMHHRTPLPILSIYRTQSNFARNQKNCLNPIRIKLKNPKTSSNNRNRESDRLRSVQDLLAFVGYPLRLWVQVSCLRRLLIQRGSTTTLDQLTLSLSET